MTQPLPLTSVHSLLAWAARPHAAGSGTASLPALWLAASCGSGPGSPPCSFFSVLHVLDVLAVILGLVLLVVLAVALYVFRKNRSASRDRHSTRGDGGEW